MQRVLPRYVAAHISWQSTKVQNDKSTTPIQFALIHPRCPLPRRRLKFQQARKDTPPGKTHGKSTIKLVLQQLTFVKLRNEIVIGASSLACARQCARTCSGARWTATSPTATCAETAVLARIHTSPGRCGRRDYWRKTIAMTENDPQ